MSLTPSAFPTAIPTSRQLEFQSWELGLFLHFGIRTFYDGHRDFDGQLMSPERFNPTQLDCEQWCRTAKDAGFKYIVFTAKHHDGFCNWPSKFTDFSVASSPWRNGQGDVMRELSQACVRHDLKLGVYYSPADWKSPVYDDPQAYDDYFINQLSELLSNYGQIDMLWLDGCGSEKHSYDWDRIVKEARRLQPEILLFNMGHPDYRWVGNEDGLTPRPLWNTIAELTGSILSESADLLSQPQWLPAECDCRMRERNWFYSSSDEHTVKSVKELMGFYYYSVGRGANLLLNIGPGPRGLLPDLDTARMLEFGAEIARRFGSPLATLEDFKPICGGWEYHPIESFYFDHVVAQEKLTKGEHIRRFSIEIDTLLHGHTIAIYEGRNVGQKAICHFPPIRARAVRFLIDESDGEAELLCIEIHCSSQ